MDKDRSRRMLEIFADYRESHENPILFLITRKGYWIFRLSYENNNELKGFKIWSDRYLTKLIDGSYLRDKDVLLFDDIMVTGDNMYYYYLLLTKWGAKVTPIALEVDILLQQHRQTYTESKKYIYDELYPSKEESKERNMEKEASINDFWKLVDKSILNERNIRKLIPEDIARLSVNEVVDLEESLCPMMIDLPIIYEISEEAKQLEPKRWINIDIEDWEQLIKNGKWAFIDNKSQEASGFEVDASFFESLECRHSLSIWAEIQDCIVKCKYKKDAESGKIRAIFVPFVIMKSMSYFEVVELFIHLYSGTAYQKLLVPESDSVVIVVQQLFKNIRTDINLYRALYRAIVFYFSVYVGRKFIEHLNNQTQKNYKLAFDVDFMTHHMPAELIETLKPFLTINYDSENDSKDVIIQGKKDFLKEMEERLSINRPNAVILEKINIYHDERSYDAWKKAYFYIKTRLVRMQFNNIDRKKIFTIEDMEKNVAELMPEMGATELRITITRIITLLQEESCFSNYLINDTEKAYVQRGFKPGANATKLIGKEAELILPYVYAYYLKTGEEHFYEGYITFVDRIKAYFYYKRYFEYRISEPAFAFYVDYFRDDTKNGWGIKEKLSQVRYIIEDYLDGNNRDYDDIFELVYEWEV